MMSTTTKLVTQIMLRNKKKTAKTLKHGGRSASPHRGLGGAREYPLLFSPLASRRHRIQGNSVGGRVLTHQTLNPLAS